MRIGLLDEPMLWGGAYGLGMAVIDPSPATRAGIATLLGLEIRPHRLRYATAQVAVVGPFAGHTHERWEHAVTRVADAVPTVCWVPPDGRQARRATELGASCVLPDDGTADSTRLREVLVQLVADELAHPVPGGGGERGAPDGVPEQLGAIWQAIAGAGTIASIARRFGYTERHFQRLCRNLYDELGVDGRAGAVACWRQRSLDETGAVPG